MTKRVTLTALHPVSVDGKSYGNNMQFRTDPETAARLVKSKEAEYAPDEGRAHREEAPAKPEARALPEDAAKAVKP